MNKLDDFVQIETCSNFVSTEGVHVETKPSFARIPRKAVNIIYYGGEKKKKEESPVECGN